MLGHSARLGRLGVRGADALAEPAGELTRGHVTILAESETCLPQLSIYLPNLRGQIGALIARAAYSRGEQSVESGKKAV